MRPIILCLICSILTLWIPANSSSVQATDDLLVFAASSLTNAFTDLAEEYESTYNIQITLNFAGSSTLAAQIEQGAPADIFASANYQQMQNIIDDDLVHEDDAHIFAENELVIIVPSDNPANIQSAFDLSQSNIFLALAAPTVPIRQYTDALLDTLAIELGDDFVESVLQNLVSEETNVRQVVARVALGEIDAGIVYRTDVTPDIAEDVMVIGLPQGASPRAEYFIAPLADTRSNDDTVSFIDFILSDDGQAILQSWGFCPPSNEDDLLPEITPESTPEPHVIDHAETYC